MYACGLRISEAATLEVPAIDSANRLLRVIGKCLPPVPRFNRGMIGGQQGTPGSPAAIGSGETSRRISRFDGEPDVDAMILYRHEMCRLTAT
jgi:hypothetical protein